MSVVRRYPLIAVFVLAYAFSWWPWPLYALDLIPGYIVGFGPFLAALVVLGPTRGKAGILGLLKAMVRWRVGLVWYAAALVVAIANGPGHLSRKRAKQTPTPPEGARPTPRVA
jgi:hypothetical protein